MTETYQWLTTRLALPLTALVLLLLPVLCSAQQSAKSILPQKFILPQPALAAQYFGSDAPWFQANIPFFDCSDRELEQVYYYRWKVYKSHLKDLGDRGYIVTEFLDDVGWAKQPYQSLNDATAFHIHEGRWLRNPRYVNDYIDYMYTGGGNDRHFSEAIADAAYADYLATGDQAFAVKHLDVMQHIYHLWDDHYDFTKGLYFIEPLLDATEYTISSIDATNGRDGFTGGNAFRPSINSFMYANALAISRLSALNGDAKTAKTFAGKAAALQQAVERDLWNDGFQHFTDRFQVSNQYVHYWDFIRGRELAGYTPWYFELPDHTPKYSAAWSHLLSPSELGGPYGIRTVEPSYQYYMKQYRYDGPTGQPECQWNGPSWPFQTTLALGGMANLLNNYSQSTVHTSDYLRLLKQYAHQHYHNGKLDLQEDYNPDTGNVIVGLPRSHHYNHSGFNDLIVTGLAGLRPRADNVLEVNPLIPPGVGTDTLQYFCLENIPYHGQSVTILYDRTGKRYGRGIGLSVYVNGRRVVAPSPLGRKTVAIAPPKASLQTVSPVNLAVNFSRQGYPVPSASTGDTSDLLFQAIDGRVWFYPEVHNFWSNEGSQSATDWFSLDFGTAKLVRSARLYFYAEGTQFQPPSRYALQYWTGQAWAGVLKPQLAPAVPLANGENIITFSPVQTSRIRVVFTNPKGGAVALVEIKAFS